MKSLCNRRVSVWNPDTLKEIVRFVHEVHPVFAVTLSSFLHVLFGWNYDTMPTFILFRVHFKCFSISGLFSSKQITKCMKNSKWCQKVLKIDDVTLNVCTERKKIWSCNKLLKFWIAGVTDEFSSETLILQKWLSNLYTKCIQFLL